MLGERKDALGGLAIVVISVAVLLGAATVGGHKAGEADAELAKQRLQLVWPSFMTMPASDRAMRRVGDDMQAVEPAG